MTLATANQTSGFSRGARLEVRALTKSFYGVRALNDVSLSVASGELVGLIGPNGSGKTTTIDCISGLQSPDNGSVLLDGKSIYRHPAHSLARLGLVRTFQSVRVFSSLSVRQNLRVAVLGRLGHKDRIVSLFQIDQRWPNVEDRIDELLEAFGLIHVSDHSAGELSYGQRKLVEFAAACVRPPRLLLLDEPVAAVNPTTINAIRDWIVHLHSAGSTILLVEHNIELVVGICERIVVLDHGVVIANGKPEAVVSTPAVQEAYFGT